jgi:two-component system, NtrC family, response regulator GlrR
MSPTTDPKSILLVDDDPNLLELLQLRLESAHHRVAKAQREEEALTAIQKEVFDLSIVDLKLAGGDGISLMENFHAVAPHMPVIILTAHGTIESAVQAMKRGAFSYLTKPFEAHDLLFQIEKAIENRKLTSEIHRLKELLEVRHDFDHIVAKSPKMQRVLEMVSRIAPTDSTVYIYGESGTGKELIAKAIHRASPRKGQAFVAINCAAIPETLLESALFGHEKGAFTGAVRSTKGLFAQAHEGSLFLDEIGDMPLTLQVKLLRVLQERQFYPIGSERSVEVDVRIIVATQKDLEAQVKDGPFREDLFYRIHVIPITLPPLRERKEEIPHLVEHFRKKYNEQMKKDIKGITPAALQKLMQYEWPGNIRELENAIEYAMAMTQQEVISDEYVLKAKGGKFSESIKPLSEAKNDFIKGYLIDLLHYCNGNVSHAAKLAGKYRADFYDLLKKYDLRNSDFKRSE